MILRGARLFDGTGFRDGLALAVEGDRIAALREDDGAGETLPGGILAPGFVDLQVNGGGGSMLDGAADAERIATICAAHARLGATGIMPTLITDTARATRAVIEAGIAAAEARVPGFLGLHLEGPHLDRRRAGAHDPALIRSMTGSDLALYRNAARRLPALIVTLAPESATPGQIAALAEAGAIVSLGHSDCTAAEAEAAFAAGATMVTHLFNAMSPLTHRAPGLVGAALDGAADCGLIADGLHVDPVALRIAVAAKRRGRMFLVSDAMAVAGTHLDGFTLGGRRILRSDGRLTLEDGTLAGADLTLPQAVALMVREGAAAPEAALAMASRIPADVIGRADLGRLAPGARADLVWLGDDLSLRGVWQGGGRLV
ncbi:N-acetylglucosamine-6-phosphate deacetylase [Paracoccus sp. S-4012]|uniref:N-acetylglucosamine-6-phosphate deacetylase n=1 Tax=Paracoccus sp. S-4012 TaxID=2665648 RepID=UPI0012AEE45A|nr:N-acetylglucosamine-6-phosphate deacetylase [Paracoccus sp. S-4012]MRX49326.1 N-acetylglucosamine-6-phosphate deacetylase [Paracoccus sp. S-4012]